MQDKNKFQEMLKDILEVARVQGNHLSIDEIKTLFGDMELTEAQYDQIYAYLVANQIKIKGYLEKNFASSIAQYAEGLKQEEKAAEAQEEETEETADITNNDAEDKITSHKDSIYLAMYLEDLSAIKPISFEEEKELFERIKKGDDLAKNRLIEGYLTQVVTIARNYINRGTLLEDLVQEGNIGLMSCLEDITALSNANEVKGFITQNVQSYIEATVGVELDTDGFENRILEKIQYISEIANELAEDLGRDADIYELAEKTNIPLDELKDIISIAGESVKVQSHHHKPNDSLK